MNRLFFLLVLLALVIWPSGIFAHSIGQPPFVKVNGIFTDYYSVPSSSLAGFDLPQDSIKESLLVGQEVKIEIDEAALPVPKEIVEKTKFLWDFGDGYTTTGLTASHAFSKPGTYFIKIRADSGEGFEAQLLQSTFINIVPSKEYKLPKSIIEISGRQSKDPLLDIIDVNFNKDINFDGSKSTGGDSEIVEYIWDTGDQNQKNETKFNYKYQENPYTVFPVLRIKTKDGFIADSFIQIKDAEAFNGGGNLITNSVLDWKIIGMAAAVSVVLAAILTFIISKFFFKK